MRPTIFIMIAVFLLGLAFPSHAWWFEYTTPEQNMPVANSDLWESDPTALPYTNGSTLVVFFQDQLGNCYQIIDRYGNLVYPEPEPIVTTGFEPHAFAPSAIPDGEGGALVDWYVTSGYLSGIHAQKIDSLGNRVWGGEGILIDPIETSQYSIGSDGMGGLLFARIGPWAVILANKFDQNGQAVWGENGVIVCSHSYGFGKPIITHDGCGGAYVVWLDYRPPYVIPDGALYAQRLDSEGNPLWTHNGIFITNQDWMYQMIPDCENGFVLLCGNGMYNDLYRFGPDGTILVLQFAVSYGLNAELVEGDSAYFYIGSFYPDGVYAQKVGMNGVLHWPSIGGSGILMTERDTLTYGPFPDFAYCEPRFFGIYSFAQQTSPYCPRPLYVQAVDTSGNTLFGDQGTLIHTIDSIYPETIFHCNNVVPDGEAGCVAVYEFEDYGGIRDIYAMHVNPDGTLGGIDPRRRHEELLPQIDGTSNNQIRFHLPESGLIKLDLYNLLGRKIRTIEEGYYPAGTHINHLNDRALSSGVYFIELTTPTARQTVKIVIVR